MEETNEQKDLLHAMNRWVTAYNDEDIDAIYEAEKEVNGFGWRSPNFRDRSKVAEIDFKRRTKNLYDSMKGWHGSYENMGIRILGDTGLLCGILTETITNLDGSVDSVKVRYSSTWIKKDGKWKQVMGHRDNQFAL